MGSPNSRRQGGGADDTTVDCDLLRRRSIIWIHTFIHGSRVSLDSGLEGSARFRFGLALARPSGVGFGRNCLMTADRECCRSFTLRPQLIVHGD
jgi:hypothetical protein